MIAFCWSGFPQYAARCVRAFVDSTSERVVVVATCPNVPIKGMEDVCGCEVVWIDREETRRMKEIAGESPRIVLSTGWHVPAFNRYCREARECGGKAICLCDNNKEGTFKEFLKGFRFRLVKKNRYDGFVVPGKSGRKLLEGYGVPAELIEEGMYCADPSLFTDGAALSERPRRIMYVGQFSERKNVLRLCEAFGAIENKRGWELHMFGCGPVKLPAMEGLAVHPFMQPEEIAVEYRKARIFCLASLEEHWGVVVHEAVLSGCALCLSSKVGAADDFLGDKNGKSFDPYDINDISNKLSALMDFDEASLITAHSQSLELSKSVSKDKFVAAVQRFSMEAK